MSNKLVRKQSTIHAPIRVSTANTVATALANKWRVAVDPEIAGLFDPGFAWFSQSNRQAVMQHLQAATVAYHHDLPRQFELHTRAVQTITFRDLADRVQVVVAKTFGYRAWRHFYPHPVSGPFVVSEGAERSVRYEWHYVGIGEFDRLIPPKALATLALLEKVGLDPQAYWVADKKESATSRIVDPILSSQFGPWFVAISEWA